MTDGGGQMTRLRFSLRWGKQMSDVGCHVSNRMQSFRKTRGK